MTRKLPAGTCIGHAVNSVQNNLAYAFRISWPWYAVLAVVSIVTFGLLGMLAAGGNADLMPYGVFFIVLLSFVAFASIAVNWHRYILLDEVPRAGDLFRLDGKTWRYLGNLILIGLIMLLLGAIVMVPLALLAGAITSSVVVSVVVILGLIVFLFLAIFSFRLSVKLPAVAIGRQDFTFSHALAATRGNTLQLFLILLFQVVLAIAASLFLLFLNFVTAFIHPIFGLAVGMLVQLFINWILTIFGITILTSLYGFFVEGREF